MKSPSGTGLEALMDLRPDCEAIVRGGRAHPAEVRLTLTHRRWDKPKRVALCRRHVRLFQPKAEGEGIVVTLGPL